MPAPDRGPRWTLGLLGGLVLLVSGVLLLVLGWLRPDVVRSGERAGADAVTGARLQAAPQSDLAGYLTEKRRQLAATGPLDGEPGYARIPLAHAMALMSERGLRADSRPATPRPGDGVP